MGGRAAGGAETQRRRGSGEERAHDADDDAGPTRRRALDVD
jgi:hypothetical protein